MNRRGATLIEALCGLMVLASALGLTLEVARLSLARLWLNHTLYQALICVAQGEDRRQCEKGASATALHGALATERLSLSLWRTKAAWEGAYDWRGHSLWGLKGQMAIEPNEVRAKRALSRWPSP